MTTSLSPQQIQALLSDYLRDQLEEWETDRALLGKKSDLSLEAYANGLEVSIDELQEAFIRNDQSVIEPHLDRYLARKGISLDKDSAEYSLLGRGFLHQMLEAHRIEQKRHQGVYTDPYAPFTLPTTASVQTVAAPVTQIQDRTKLSDALDKYISIKSQTWKQSSQKDTIPSLKDFVVMVGDKEVRTLNRDHMREYQRIMHYLPSRNHGEQSPWGHHSKQRV